jgi:hypothetical protein
LLSVCDRLKAEKVAQGEFIATTLEKLQVGFMGGEDHPTNTLKSAFNIRCVLRA